MLLIFTAVVNIF